MRKFTESISMILTVDQILSSGLIGKMMALGYKVDSSNYVHCRKSYGTEKVMVYNIPQHKTTVFTQSDAITENLIQYLSPHLFYHLSAISEGDNFNTGELVWVDQTLFVVNRSLVTMPLCETFNCSTLIGFTEIEIMASDMKKASKEEIIKFFIDKKLVNVNKNKIEEKQTKSDLFHTELLDLINKYDSKDTDIDYSTFGDYTYFNVHIAIKNETKITPIKDPIVLSCLNITGRGTVLVVNDEETYNINDRVWFDDVIYVVIGVEISSIGSWVNTHKGLVVKKEKL